MCGSERALGRSGLRGLLLPQPFEHALRRWAASACRSLRLRDARRRSFGAVSASSSSHAASVAGLLGLTLAQALQRRLRLRERRVAGARRRRHRRLEPAHRLRRLGDAPTALELGEPARRHLVTHPLQPGDLAREGRRAPRGSRRGRPPARRSPRPPRSRDPRARPRAPRLRAPPGRRCAQRAFEPLALGLVLGDGDRQRPLAALDRRRRIADLLVQDEQRVTVGQLLLGRRGSDRGSG